MTACQRCYTDVPLAHNSHASRSSIDAVTLYMSLQFDSISAIICWLSLMRSGNSNRAHKWVAVSSFFRSLPKVSSASPNAFLPASAPHSNSQNGRILNSFNYFVSEGKNGEGTRGVNFESEWKPTILARRQRSLSKTMDQKKQSNLASRAV